MMTETITPRLAPAPPRLFDRGEWGTVHIDAETCWTLADFLVQMAGEIHPHEHGAEGFKRQEALLGYATELKAAAAAHLDADDGAQCRARLAEIAADEERSAKNHAARMAAEQAGQNPPQMHA